MFEEKAFKFETELGNDSPVPGCDHGPGHTVMKFSKFEDELAEMKDKLESPNTPRTPGPKSMSQTETSGFKLKIAATHKTTYEEPELKVFNFSNGPSILPKDVLKQAQSEVLNWQGKGLSVMEMNTQNSHFL